MKKLSGRLSLCGLFLTLAFWCGCMASPGAGPPPLSAAAAQYTIDAWNPSYCKVAEFYGLYQPESAASRVAYVSIANPSDKAQKPLVYAATFQELSRADGRQQWFLTGLVTHSSGILTKRQGWDDLMVPVQEAPPAAAQKKS